ncbi:MULTISPECIES: hypothetical protein [Microbispora]|uniref:hypothetical protein n=1 Tax=Microbispora TaxID=2005 RepID=UPI0011C73AC6|nr:hypothetical protein [Microbispora sp. CSR-4]
MHQQPSPPNGPYGSPAGQHPYGGHPHQPPFGGPAQRPPAWQPPPPHRKKGKGPGFWLLVIGLPFVLLFGCMAAVGSLASDRSSTTSTAAKAHKPSAAADSDATAAEKAGASEEPSSPPSSQPKPRTYSGAGAKVLKLRKSDWTAVWLVTLTHRGGSNFIVSPLDPGGAEQGAIVNEIGDYKGSVLLNEDDGKDTAALKIQADGAWTIVLKPLSMARVWSGGSLTGRGDEVAIIAPPSVGLTTVNARHSGSANFIVEAWTETSRELIVNEIGSWHGEVPLPSGTILVTIKADGVWSFKKS